MKNKTLILFITLIIVSCNKKNETNYDKNIAKVEFEKTYNFGNITHNDTVKHIFKVKNVGENPLKITRIGTSCGCTGAILTDSIAEKGETCNIEIKYIPKKDQEGEIKNSVVVEANTNPTYFVMYLQGKLIE